MDETMNEIRIPEKIEVQAGKVFFNSTELRSQAEQIAAFVNRVTAEPNDLKYAKKVLAAANKAMSEISKRRISIKKKYMAGYESFEFEMKEIGGIIEAADEKLRSIVKNAGQEEKEEKRGLIEDMFNFYLPVGLREIVTFDWVFQSDFLNRSVTMFSIENKMKSDFERIQTEIDSIKKMDDSEWIMAEYMERRNLAETLQAYQKRQENMTAVKRQAEEETHPGEPILTIVVKDPFFAELALNLLNQHGIEFEVLKND